MTSDVIIAEQFHLKRKIGSGSFGEIFSATHMQSGEEFAVKLEKIGTRFPQLAYEAKVISKLGGGIGFPKVYWTGTEKNYNIMVMQLLGPSLENLFEFCKRSFSVKTVLMIAEQMLQRIEYIHNKGFLHRDIKPDNFLIGKDSRQDIIHMIDFGLAKMFRGDQSHVHIPYSDKKSLTGTARYASINTHKGIEQSRRDDIEAIGYVLMYFLQGELPWQGLMIRGRDEKYKKIMNCKVMTEPEMLCMQYPSQFADYLRYARSLEFEDVPDYGYLRRMFSQLFVEELYDFDYVYDWTLLSYGRTNLRHSNSMPILQKDPTPVTNLGRIATEEHKSPQKKQKNKGDCALF